MVRGTSFGGAVAYFFFLLLVVGVAVAAAAAVAIALAAAAVAVGSVWLAREWRARERPYIEQRADPAWLERKPTRPSRWRYIR